MTIATSQLYREIQEQPSSLSGLMASGWPQVLAAARKIRDFDPTWCVIAARGTSDNAARYAKYLLGSHNGLGVGLAVPSLFTLYGTPPNLKGALTIGISQSGQSPDVVSVLTEARRQGGFTLAITNEPDSPLAQAADACIQLFTEETSVAATKTYTNQLLAIAMLSAALSEEPRRIEALRSLPRAVNRALAKVPVNPGRGFQGCDRFVVASRGFNYCTAFEISLKMKETSYVLAEPYSVADLLHGPVALIEASFPVLLVAPNGKANDQFDQLLELLTTRKARIIAISDRDDVLDAAEVALPLPPGVPEWLSPIVSVVPGQLWAQSLAVAKRIDPDRPRGLSKVTLTL